MYDMINIFEVFLPQLLRYPNPTDPLNGEAAALLMREPKNYETKVKGKSQMFPQKNTMLKTGGTNAVRICPQVCEQRGGGRGGRRVG